MFQLMRREENGKCNGSPVRNFAYDGGFRTCNTLAPCKLRRIPDNSCRIALGESTIRGAEGATAPETLRQKDQREVLNSGDKAKVKAEAGRRDNNLRHMGQRGLIRFGVLWNVDP